MNISFAHNVQIRHKTLKETIDEERNFFPNSKIYVAYNDNNFNLNYFKDLNNIKFIKYIGEGHKIGCINGCITSINETLLDDSDIVVFSHDDVKINPEYINIFNEKVQEIFNGDTDVICRHPNSFGDNYYMMEGFIMNKLAAKKIFELQTLFNSENNLPHDKRNSPSPEVWLYNVLNAGEVKVTSIIYQHNDSTYNKVLGETLGFFHKNAGQRGWRD